MTTVGGYSIAATSLSGSHVEHFKEGKEAFEAEPFPFFFLAIANYH